MVKYEELIRITDTDLQIVIICGKEKSDIGECCFGVFHGFVVFNFLKSSEANTATP